MSRNNLLSVGLKSCVFKPQSRLTESLRFTQSFLSVRGVRTRDEPLRTFAWEATSIRDPPNPKEKSARAFKEGIYFTPTSIYTAILLFFSEENHFSSS